MHPRFFAGPDYYFKWAAALLGVIGSPVVGIDYQLKPGSHFARRYDINHMIRPGQLKAVEQGSDLFGVSIAPLVAVPELRVTRSFVGSPAAVCLP
jgi:hypothetical protein